MKRTFSLISALCLFVCLCGCTSQFKLDTDSLEAEINNEISFETKLAKVQTKVACRVYDIDEGLIKKCTAYVSNAATVDEFSIWEVIIPDDAQEVEDKINQRVQNQIEVYSAYDSEQAARMRNAVVVRKGAYVAYCVCKDYEAAKTLLEKYFK